MVEVVECKRLEINFLMICLSQTVISIYLRDDQSEVLKNSQDFERQLYLFWLTYFDVDEFMDVLRLTIKEEILVYDSTTDTYSQLLEQTQTINSLSLSRQQLSAKLQKRDTKIYNSIKCKYNTYENEDNLIPDPKKQLDEETSKFFIAERNIERDSKQIQQLEMYVFLNEMNEKIASEFNIQIKQGTKQQLFNSQNQNVILAKLDVPVDKNVLELATIELLLAENKQVSRYIGILMYERINLLKNKFLLRLHKLSPQRLDNQNQYSDTLDIHKYFTIPLYLQPFSQSSPTQKQFSSASNFHQNSPIYLCESTSLNIYSLDYENQLIKCKAMSSIQPQSFPENQKKSISKLIKNESSCLNDWFAKIIHLLLQCQDMSYMEKLKYLFDLLGSAFSPQLTLRHVLLLQQAILQMEGAYLDFDCLLHRASSIFDLQLQNEISFKVNIISSQLSQMKALTLEVLYESIFKESLLRAIHQIDIRSAMSQVHKNIQLEKLPIIQETQPQSKYLAGRYELIVTVNGARNEWLIDEEYNISLTQQVHEQKVLITSINLFKDIPIQWDSFLSLMQSTSCMMDMFLRFDTFNFFPMSIPVCIQVQFNDCSKFINHKSRLMKQFTLFDLIHNIIEAAQKEFELILPSTQSHIKSASKESKMLLLSTLSQQSKTENGLDFNKIVCYYKRQLLRIDDNLANQIDLNAFDPIQTPTLTIILDVFVSQKHSSSLSSLSLNSMPQNCSPQQDQTTLTADSTSMYALIIAPDRFHSLTLERHPLNPDVYQIGNCMYTIPPTHIMLL